MFLFSYDKFDFWPIYQTIIRFYPLGIKKDETKFFFEYPGYKELRKIITDEIVDKTQFEHWNNFTNQIAKETGKYVFGTTNILNPCLSSYIELEKNIADNLIRTKELHFYVSLLGPFYTVFGQDKNTVKMEDNDSYHSTNYFAVSPENEFAEGFNIVCEKIEKQFKGFRFVPFHIYQQKVEGLFIHNWNENATSSVFHALFNNSIDFDNVRTLGKEFYKSEDWIKEGYVDTGAKWISYPPDRRHT
ncbi:hypothetical protein [Pinibacter soli]|uniref:Uncharacterized protein n=1 Tax=Pinibacter soli TaxID=3044211 RepID=A0ABT6RFZ5_9BACT|nr:hypothetical protein [Pinibacter soli]MDI3321492.1 hypothetical protein [Pinibacter soli]